MSVISRKGPIVDPGVCRCCGATKKCRLLNVEYLWLGQREVYSDMFVDCFGLVLSNLDGEDSERLICATCVVRLRDARAFKHQVLQCEEKLLHATIQVHNEFNIQVKMEEVPIKHEIDIVEEPLVAPQYSEQNVHMTQPVEVKNGLQLKETMESMPRVQVKQEIEIALEQGESKQLHVRGPEGATIDRGKYEMLRKLNLMKKKVNQMRRNNAQRKVEKVSEGAGKPGTPRRRTEGSTKKAQKNTQDNQNGINTELAQTQQSNAPQPESLEEQIEKEHHALQNTHTIVENSYVCPFVTVFKDTCCVYCREIYLDFDKLREHTMTHDPSTYKDVLDPKKQPIQVDITRIDCRLCDEKIDSIDIFKRHITSVHGKHLHTDVTNEFMKFKLQIGNLDCLECGKKIGPFFALKKHMVEHFGSFVCDICGSHFYETRRLKVHKAGHFKTFPCTECNKTFRTKGSRNVHISRNHRNEPAIFPCHLCGKPFSSQLLKTRHRMEEHGEKTEFSCEECGKVYTNRKAFREHNIKAHIKAFKHECQFCDKKFYIPSALKDHMLMHTGEKNFSCDICGKNFPRLKALRIHVYSHRSEKRFKCSLCPAAYTQVTNFKNHMKNKHPTDVES